MISINNLVRKIAGDENEIGLQHRVLNMAIMTGIITSFLSLINNYLLSLHWITIFISIMGIIVFTLSYVHSRYTNRAIHIRYSSLIFLILVFQPVLWITNGGTKGSFEYYVPLILVISHISNTGRSRVFFVLLQFVVTISLVIAEYFYPNLVIQYDNVEAQYIDLIIGYTLSFAGISIYLNIYYNQYVRANNKLLSQNDVLLRNQEEILTQQIEIERQRDELQEKTINLQELNATKDRFFSIIAHDLKNPFSSILSLSDMLAESKEKITDKNTCIQIDLIQQSSQNAYKLLLNLLEWSRIQTNSIDCNAEKINLPLLISENVALMEAQARNKNLDIVFKNTKICSVFADKHMLNSILRNLVSNAIKYTKKGEVRIDFKNELNVCMISVIDTGVGMDQDTVNNLFSIDKCQSMLGTNDEPGTGLGLILCKEFTEKNGGHITVSSQVNKGSVFTVSIPLS